MCIGEGYVKLKLKKIILLYLYLCLLLNEVFFHSVYIITQPLAIPVLTNICSLHCTILKSH